MKKIVLKTNQYTNEVIVVAPVEVHIPPIDHTHVHDVVITDIDPELGVGNGPIEPRSRVREGMTRGGKVWDALDVEELKGGFLLSQSTLGMEKQPNVRSYWQKMEPFLWCHVKDKYLAISSCLHLVDPSDVCHDHISISYDELSKA